MGMQGFMQKINKIENLTKFDIAKEVTDIINSNQDYMTSVLKSQLKQGKDANNEWVTFGEMIFTLLKR